MTNISNLTGTTGAQASTPSTPTNPNASLGKDDFLKLFVAQMQHQDPMNPTDNSEFMAQMAQFSSLEQMSNMAKSNQELVSALSLGQAVGLIGRSVTYTDAAGAEQSGVVEKVSTEGGSPVLTVAGKSGVLPSSITQVA